MSTVKASKVVTCQKQNAVEGDLNLLAWAVQSLQAHEQQVKDVPDLSPERNASNRVNQNEDSDQDEVDELADLGPIL